MNDDGGDGRDLGIGLPFGPNNEWTVHMTWRVGDHNGPSHLVVEPTDPDNYPSGGISQTVLREIKFSDAIELVRKGREAVREASRERPGPPEPIDWGAMGRRLVELSDEGGLSDSYLATLSWAYSAAASKPRPAERLSSITGKSAAAIKSHLWQATRRDLLYRSPGRAGGAVTEKALRILNAVADADNSRHVIEDKPNRRRPQKAITPRTQT